MPKDEARLLHMQLNKEYIQKINIFVAALGNSLEHKAIIAKIIAERIVR